MSNISDYNLVNDFVSALQRLSWAMKKSPQSVCFYQTFPKRETESLILIGIKTKVQNNLKGVRYE
jgi:hypothetical protein